MIVEAPSATISTAQGADLVIFSPLARAPLDLALALPAPESTPHGGAQERPRLASSSAGRNFSRNASPENGF